MSGGSVLDLAQRQVAYVYRTGNSHDARVQQSLSRVSHSPAGHGFSNALLFRMRTCRRAHGGKAVGASARCLAGQKNDSALAPSFRKTNAAVLPAYTGDPFTTFHFQRDLPPDVIGTADSVTGWLVIAAPLALISSAGL